MAFRFENNTRDFVRNVGDITKAIEAELAIAGVRLVRKYTPVDTGRLRNSIDCEDTGQGWVVFSDVEYCGYVEEGTAYTAPAAMFARGMAELRGVLPAVAARVAAGKTTAGNRSGGSSRGGFFGRIGSFFRTLFGR